MSKLAPEKYKIITIKELEMIIKNVPPQILQAQVTHFLFFFFFFWLRWLFIAACWLSLVAMSRGYSSLRFEGFSLGWLLLLRSTASRCASVVVACGLSSCGSWALECRLSSCGTWAQLLRDMWDPPGAGIEPVSPSLAGRFLTTEPPGKSNPFYFLTQI